MPNKSSQCQSKGKYLLFSLNGRSTDLAGVKALRRNSEAVGKRLLHKELMHSPPEILYLVSLHFTDQGVYQWFPVRLKNVLNSRVSGGNQSLLHGP